MSISYTSKEAVDVCLENEFKKNTIQFNKSYLNNHGNIGELEMLIEIVGKDINIIDNKCTEGNEWKFQMFVNFLNLVVSTYNMDLNCKFIVCINDGVQLTDKYTKFSTFGRHKSSNHIGLPDPLVSGVLTFNQKIREHLDEDIDFSQKKDGIIFRGSDTSKQRDNLLNQRLMFCIDHKDSDYIDSKITFYAHYSDDMLKNHGIKKEDITSDRTSSGDQLKYKYIAYINGNTVSGDRMMWQLASNSLLIQVKPKENEDDYIWYHSLLNSLDILPTFEEETFLEDFKEFEKKEYIEGLIKKQQYFASIILDSGFQMLYTKEALEKYNQIYNAS
jgi:hypothetical protein